MTPEHTTDINSECWTDSKGAHHYMFYKVRKLLHTFEEFVAVWRPWCSCIKYRHVICNGDFSWLRIKSRDVTPWGLVDGPKQFGGTCCLPVQGMRVLSFWTWRWKCQVPPRCWYLCQTPLHHIPWTHNINTFYTENTDFTCILSAFRIAQHDSSSLNRSIVKVYHAGKLTFL